jgi:hypothetical protein
MVDVKLLRFYILRFFRSSFFCSSVSKTGTYSTGGRTRVETRASRETALFALVRAISSRKYPFLPKFTHLGVDWYANTKHLADRSKRTSHPGFTA